LSPLPLVPFSTLDSNLHPSLNLASLELTRPWALLALLAAPVLVYYFVWSLSDFPRRQRIVSLAVRVAIVLLLVLALAGLTWLNQTDRQYVLFLVDQSQSVGAEAQQRAAEYLKAAVPAAGENRVAYLPFAAQPGFVQNEPVVYGDEPTLVKQAGVKTSSDPASPRPGLGNDDNVTSATPNVDRSTLNPQPSTLAATNLAAAIEAAAGYVPPGYVPQLVLLTDGNQTAGDALQAAARSRVPITTVPLPSRSEPEVQVSEVNVPAEVREGEPFNVDVTIHSNHDDVATIEVFRGDHRVVNEKRPLKTGENRFRFPQSIDRDRLAQFTVRVSDLKQDTLLDNNSEAGLVFAAGKPRVLIIESDPNLIRELAYALEDEGIQVDVRPPQGMPDSLADLQNYELVMLSNVPATALTLRQMDVARTWVQELGGGFIMLGGEQSFGLGGYYKSTLEEILPVRSDFEKEKEKPSLAMVLVIDKSGSMDGDKIEMAKSAARSAVELLGKRDFVAVVAFDGDTYVISEMQSAANKDKIEGDIATIEAGGGTTMYPAMEQGYELLTATQAKLKHMILLTDGVSSPGDFQALADQMASNKMTVSSVAVGSDCDATLLEEIARVGRGRYYLAEDPATVPQIFAKETVTASKSAIDESPFLPQVIRATHALKDIDLGSAPFLLGYVMTRPKPTSEVILATEKGDPLLVWWRYGLGMTAAFTSDAKNRWAAEWMTWPGFGKFWTQVIRHTMRKSDAQGLAVDVARLGPTANVTVDAVDPLGRFLNQADVELTWIDPRLGRKTEKLSQSAPGRYGGSLPLDQRGAYHLEIAVKQQGQVVYRQSRGLTVGYSDELRIKPTNTELLEEIAAVSGGRCDPPAEQLFDPDGRTATNPTPLWPWLLTVALVLFLADVALRRIDFSLPLWSGRRAVAR
jgi:Ca-activated chloride channel family protein